MSGIIASEFVGHQPPGFTPLAFEQAAKEAFSRMLIATALHQNVKDIPVLIDGPPQVVLFSLNSDEHFINMPGVT
jgi:hypothetical protein